MGHHTSAHCTFAINPPFTKSNQFASYSLGPMRKFKSVIRSSSLTRVAASWKAIKQLLEIIVHRGENANQLMIERWFVLKTKYKQIALVHEDSEPCEE